MNRLLDWAERKQWSNGFLLLWMMMALNGSTRQWDWFEWPRFVANLAVCALATGTLVRSFRRRRAAP